MQKDLEHITSLLQKDYVMPKELENSVHKTLMNALVSLFKYNVIKTIFIDLLVQQNVNFLFISFDFLFTWY